MEWRPLEQDSVQDPKNGLLSGRLILNVVLILHKSVLFSIMCPFKVESSLFLKTYVKKRIHFEL